MKRNACVHPERCYFAQCFGSGFFARCANPVSSCFGKAREKGAKQAGTKVNLPVCKYFYPDYKAQARLEKKDRD